MTSGSAAITSELQEDNHKLVLTDLESTNGTRVNGEEIRVRILRDGDMIALGRSVLLVGSHSDIDRRIQEIAAKIPPAGAALARANAWPVGRHRRSQLRRDRRPRRCPMPLPPGGPPPLPTSWPRPSRPSSRNCSTTCRACSARWPTAVMRPGGERVEIDFPSWQALLDLQATLAELLRRVSEPG